MKTKTPIKPFLLGALLMLFSGGVAAAELTPQSYVVIDLEVRLATLDGMAERVQLLSGGADVAQQEMTLDELNRKQVAAIFRKYGSSAAAHAAYGTRRNAEIREWLDADPDSQRQYQLLGQQFDALSDQLDALSKGQ
jgi:hypothetical protein